MVLPYECIYNFNSFWNKFIEFLPTLLFRNSSDSVHLFSSRSRRECRPWRDRYSSLSCEFSSRRERHLPSKDEHSFWRFKHISWADKSSSWRIVQLAWRDKRSSFFCRVIASFSSNSCCRSVQVAANFLAGFRWLTPWKDRITFHWIQRNVSYYHWNDNVEV